MNHFFLYGFKFKIKDLNPDYRETKPEDLKLRLSPLVEKYIPQAGGVSRSEISYISHKEFFYIGFITWRLTSGQMVSKDDYQNPFQVDELSRLALIKGWIEAKSFSQATAQEPDVYFL